MKRTVKLSLLLIAIALVSFVSCVEDDPEEEKKAPTITINSPTADTIYAQIGETIIFDITIISQKTMASIMTIAPLGVEVADKLINFNRNSSINEKLKISAKNFQHGK
jgi:hypothetical protein